VLEISQGLQGMKFSEVALRSPIRTPEEEGFSRAWCRSIKEDGATTILTGGLRIPGLIWDIMEHRETDLVGLCRPLIREPGLIRRWQEGDLRKSDCISCNRCAFAVAKGLPLRCYSEEGEE
jgi:2,4-dienoyl-CoA reductase-like NADH-dependent reductase (Old Yellow Enzyme family)